jgi:hypothetical protein
MQNFKGLKNTLYQDLISRKVIDCIQLCEESFDYDLVLKGKSATLKVTSFENELSAFSFLSKIESNYNETIFKPIQSPLKERALDLSAPFNEKYYLKIIEKTLELGFTHLICSVRDPNFLELAKKENLKVGTKVRLSLEDFFSQEDSVFLPHSNSNFIVYESLAHQPLFLSHPDNSELLIKEMLIKEMEFIANKHPCIWYQLPEMTGDSLRMIDLKAPENIHFVLDKVPEIKLGTPVHIHFEIINSLNPFLGAIDAQDKLKKMRADFYKGLIVKVDRLPGAEGFLEANLWSLAHAQARLEPVEDLLEIALRYNQVSLAKEDLLDFSKLLKAFRGIETKEVDVEYAKVIANKILSDIIFLEKKIFPLDTLYRDLLLQGRHTLSHFCQAHNIHMPNLLRESDFVPSFYTEAFSLGGSSARTMAKISFKDKFDKDSVPETLKPYYHQNSLF